MTWHHGGFNRPIAAIAAVLAAGAVAYAYSPPAGAAGACDRFASPTGSDSAAGTQAAPLRTVQRLLDSLSPGQTGCLRAGAYSADQIKLEKPGVTLTSYAGERATLRGRLRFEATADRAVVQGLVLDGRNSGNQVGPLVYADGAVLRGNDISNGKTGSSCVHLDSYPGSPAPQGVVIEGNRIHDCGTLPATNKHHGIYVGDAQGTVIRNNLIYDNANRGIQLYPDADGSKITGNVIDGNGQGIIFGSDDTDSPDGNLVQGNLITNSRIRWNVESHTQGAPYGQGNVVRGNCVHGGARGSSNGGIQSPQQGFTASGNLVADPRYVNRAAGNFALSADSPCRSILSDGAAAGTNGPRGRAGGGAVTLNAAKKRVARGTRVRLHGRALTGAPTVRVFRATGGRWKPVRTVRVTDRRYTVRCLINRGRIRFKAEGGGVASNPITVRGRRGR